MPLKLTIASFQRLSPGQEPTKILDHGSLTIGRAAQNGWILQDPERILSSSHCAIHFQDGGYYLTDTSTNGTFLNDSEQRIPRNQTVRLNDGDHFVMGEYEIEARLIPGGAEHPLAEEGSITDIVPIPHSVATPSGHGLLDLKQPAGPPAKGAVVTEPPPDQLTPERASFEPPELIPGTPPTPPEPTSGPPVPESIPGKILPPVPPQVSAETSIPAIPDLIPASAAAEVAGAIIPEDWWLGPPAAPITPRPVIETLPPPPPPAEPAQVKTPPPELSIPRRPAPSAQPPVKPAGIDANNLFQAFLEGAGLPRALPTAEQQLEIMANLGAIFRETVQGLTEILLARGDVKGEFRLDRTAIGPMENNPLKTPPGRPPLNPEEVMNLLLIRQKDAYMSPVQAVHESFNDIKAHQLAVMAGIQAALNRLLERFDPHNLETRLQQTVLDSFLPASRKAKYWDLFTTEYQAIAREAEDDFNELFGDEFARAYEERLGARR